MKPYPAAARLDLLSVDPEAPEVHLLPVEGCEEHFVPGGLTGAHVGDDQVTVTVAAELAHNQCERSCWCCPSVRAVRDGDRVHRELTHYGRDDT